MYTYTHGRSVEEPIKVGFHAGPQLFPVHTPPAVTVAATFRPPATGAGRSDERGTENSNNNIIAAVTTKTRFLRHRNVFCRYYGVLFIIIIKNKRIVVCTAKFDGLPRVKQTRETSSKSDRRNRKIKTRT